MEAASRFPDWCEASPQLYSYLCEQYVESPIWCSVLVLDFVALWLIAAISWRQREQAKAARAERLLLPRPLRTRRLWRSLAGLVRLGTLAAKQGAWQEGWRRVASARKSRKDFLLRRDFHLPGVLQRAAGPLLLMACGLLIFFEIRAYLTVGLPHLRPPAPLQAAGRLLGWFVGLRIALDYARVALTDPGAPEAEAPVLKSGDIELAVRMERFEKARRCYVCRAPKPARTHHCRVCRRCVLKMDHHCPFVNNCVGLRNYRYFLYFLLDLVLGCCLVLSSLFPMLPGAITGSLEASLARRLHVIAASAVSMVASAALIPFLCFHLQLVLMNKTSLELLGDQGRPRPAGKPAPPAAAGGAGVLLENFMEVCGPLPGPCVPWLEALLSRLLPPRMVRLAKRSE